LKNSKLKINLEKFDLHLHIYLHSYLYIDSIVITKCSCTNLKYPFTQECKVLNRMQNARAFIVARKPPTVAVNVDAVFAFELNGKSSRFLPNTLPLFLLYPFAYNWTPHLPPFAILGPLCLGRILTAWGARGPAM